MFPFSQTCFSNLPMHVSYFLDYPVLFRNTGYCENEKSDVLPVIYLLFLNTYKKEPYYAPSYLSNL